MKYVVLLSLLLAAESHAQSYLGSGLKFGSFYETNTFYASDNQKADLAFLIEPNLVYSKEVGNKYSVQTDSTVSYTKYLSNTNQDYFDYNVNLKNNFKFSPKFQVSITPKAKLISEPALAKTEDRLERQFVGGTLGMILAKDPRRQYILEATFMSEQLSQKDYEYLNNQAIDGKLYYKKYFLPETFVYAGVSGGVRVYPDGQKAANSRFKYDSQRVEPGFGLEGRLTRHFKIRSYFGYAVIQYKKYANYNDPIYLLELEEEISPKDYLLMGLENSVDDSYFTNFQINQKIYVGYGRFIGDQVLWVTKTEYVYRTFSNNQRRDDQRFIVDTRMEYSYSQNLKIETSLLFDVLSSDGVDPDGPIPAPIDPSSSYRNTRFGVYGKYSF